MLMFSAGTHVDIASPAIRQGFARGVLALAVVAVTAVPIGLLLDHALGVGHPALIAVIVTGSSAAIAFPIIEERQLAGPNVAFLIAWVALAELRDRRDHAADARQVGEPVGGDRWRRRGHRRRRDRAPRRRAGHAVKALCNQMRAESLQRGWAWQVRISLVLLLGLSAIAQETGASTLVAGLPGGDGAGSPARVGSARGPVLRGRKRFLRTAVLRAARRGAQPASAAHLTIADASGARARTRGGDDARHRRARRRS